MSTQPSITDRDELWEDGTLGRDENHVRVSNQDNERQLHDTLCLQAISIRLQKSLIEDLKNIAALNGIGYQPLIRQILTRFADSEKKRILREAVRESKAIIEGDSDQAQRAWDDQAPEQQCA